MIGYQEILFTPEVELDTRQAPAIVPIKGQLPQKYYPFALMDIYPLIPSLTAFDAYRRIVQEFQRVDETLYRKLKLRSKICFPIINNNQQALSVIFILFDPSDYCTGNLWKKVSITESGLNNSLMVENALPFPMKLASPQKLLHSLVWIDTNIKVQVENITKSYNIKQSDIQQIVESALKIYSYLIKQQDYQLARSINFNHSIFLQERILNLLFGDAIYIANPERYERAKAANHIALELLKNISYISYTQFCALSVFMGIINTSGQEIQKSFKTDPEQVLGEIDTQLNALQQNMCINHIDQFLADMEEASPFTISVILDDNGESVFDIALFQKLLRDVENLNIVFIVNYYPVSINISFNSFQNLLSDDYFADLRLFIKQGRVKLCIERQVFTSFERERFLPQTWEAIKQSRFTYIKGVAFFETLQIPEITRYHSFTIHGQTSKILTGYPEGEGVFVKLQPNQEGFTYHSYDHIETLRDKIKSVKEERQCQIELF